MEQKKQSLKGKLTLNKETAFVIGKQSAKKVLGGATPAGTGMSTGSTYTCWQTFNSNCCGGGGSDTL